MGYTRVEDVLPKEVIEMIQKYVDGQGFSVPMLSEKYFMS